MNNKTVIMAEPGIPIIRIERVFDAPREKVFQVFTQKDKVAKWWSPSNEVRIDALDAREGGAWKFTHVIDGQDITFYGVFHEVTAPERIVQTAEFANLGERGHVVLDKYEFTEFKGGQTHMTLTEAYLTTQDRDAALKSGMETGLAQSYINLDTVLREMN
ncbi:Activator of Hsp90 ATPase 1 family protein [candidate division TM7 genomosp. GTL1]|nr:Activator of Hsp90 ATPase 1 family protein [candidate division TM7 genomosp. GTL1]